MIKIIQGDITTLAVDAVVETAWVDGADVPPGEMRVASKENEIVAISRSAGASSRRSRPTPGRSGSSSAGTGAWRTGFTGCWTWCSWKTCAALGRAMRPRTAAPCARLRSCCCGATPSAAWGSARCARSARGTSRRRRKSFSEAKGRRWPHRGSQITPPSQRPRLGRGANPGTCPQGDHRAGVADREQGEKRDSLF